MATSVSGRWGLVSSGSCLSTEAGVAVLEEGGSAFDATIAMAACLMVALPMSCGLGGDLLFMGYDAQRQHPFQHAFLGRAPRAATIEAFAHRGRDVPLRGLLAATAPAAVEGLLTFHERYGGIPLAALLEPALRAAVGGMTVTQQFNRWTSNNLDVVLSDPALMALYAPEGRAVEAGSRLRQPGLASSLELMARRPGQATQDIRRELVRLSNAHDGLFCEADFSRSQELESSWLSFDINGDRLLTPALPTQGYLLGQNLSAYDAVMRRGPINGPAEEIHVWSEIYNQTYGLRLKHAADPIVLPQALEVLDTKWIGKVAGAVDRTGRTDLRYRGYYDEGDTTHFVVQDDRGNVVTAIMSLSHGFGCGLTSASHGLTFNNRLGRSATLDRSHPNCVGPGKRPINTIMAYLVLRDGKPLLAGGTPGGDGQAQWNSVFLGDVLLKGDDPEFAITRPRFTSVPGADKGEANMAETLEIENGYAPEVYEHLSTLGHNVRIKTRVQGALRAVMRREGDWVCVDDGHEEGITAALQPGRRQQGKGRA
jgi:gamma-glutamyltranspeptidase/glutathione hydrolase